MRSTKTKILTLIFSICYMALYGQNSNPCTDIKELYFGEKFYNPNGSSVKYELFKDDYSRLPKYFQEEHNLFFYEFTAQEEGLLTLTISPNSDKDDYDFILFQTDNTCDKLFENLESPLRSNLARNDKKIKSNTGLDLFSPEPQVGIGPGNSFSKALEIKKGQKYYLVVDNVYPNGSGHSIELKLNPLSDQIPKFTPKKLFVSLLSNERPRMLKGKIQIEDVSDGKMVYEKIIKSPKDSLDFLLQSDKKYFLYAYADSFLFNSVEVSSLENNKEIKVFLDTLLVGRKFTLYNVNFEPNSANIKEDENLDLNRLVNFLQNNPKYFIEVQGHTNYNIFSDRNYLMDLSFRRALAIKSFLVKKGVEESRINCSGMGGSAPLVISDDQQIAMKNLRVEIVLIDKEK